MSPVFANDALLLIGHGSARYPDAARALHQHAAALHARAAFRQIRVGVLNGTPTVAEALAGIDAAIIRVVPFFMEDGYFTRIAIPRLLPPDPRIRRCPPIGIHDGIQDIMTRQAHQACTALAISPNQAAILLVGHGSASAPGRALALQRHAARLAATATFATTISACLEEPPLLADALRALRAHPVIVIGFFANTGMHMRDDVPAAIAAEQAARGRAGQPVHFHGSVTDDPAMPGIIADQAAKPLTERAD